MKDMDPLNRSSDVILEEDWVAPNVQEPVDLGTRTKSRDFISLRRSPLARKIIWFNLIALAVLVAGILYSNSAQNSLALQRSAAISNEARLIADVFEVGLSPMAIEPENAQQLVETLGRLSLPNRLNVFMYDASGQLVASREKSSSGAINSTDGSTILTDSLSKAWQLISSPFSDPPSELISISEQLQQNVLVAQSSNGTFNGRLVGPDGAVFSAGKPIVYDGKTVGTIAVTSTVGEIDRLARAERERVLQMFLIATMVSIGLSLVLASTIANPIADLSEAAELGRDKNSRKVNPGRIRIPDLTARPDEIGRLSGALRSMVAALYTRIEGNEQFAADVSHEIKNPLASLRSAVGTLRRVSRDDQRETLLDVIDHDVRRLDRIVSDISNASRLDAELVKEEEEPFDLLKMIGNLGQYLGEDAGAKGIDFILDVPEDPVIVTGLEARLAQVFVNLITNAISFCEDGDAIRVWARKRENRILVVVEDTGPGIPDEALGNIFKRFYSERPREHFGNNSGLGLAISKQIAEAHGGVIWAENIRPTDADVTSEPLGARFVVGLPL